MSNVVSMPPPGAALPALQLPELSSHLRWHLERRGANLPTYAPIAPAIGA